MIRKSTKKIKVGSVCIGGDSPVSIQSMTNTDTRDAEKTLIQIRKLEDAGCEIIRVAVPDEIAAENIKVLKDNMKVPLIADIHFDYKLAIKSFEKGADCIRINPGNIGGTENTIKVIDAAKLYKCAIRLGVNSGSLEKDIVKRLGVSSSALVESAMRNVELFERCNFDNFKISIKASNVPMTIDAYRKISQIVDYPLHIGVTEAGTTFAGTIKSSVGIGTLLSEGIGDTIRVSLTSDPVDEVRVAWEILKSLNLREHGAELISCPTCGRTEIDMIGLATEAESIANKIKGNISIAVMGCPVNGPGEAKEADYGIAGGRKLGIIFKKGVIVKKVREEELIEELKKILAEDGYL